ncbi:MULTISPECIES: ABC transporter substrate-binding protein [unclassified Beijerinckia]|uniref:ABC transporter substrate-binding protein n=1 Tax=unclassified Beijerinckia TaxID=2638183 RepID=UPI0008989992|nr:MULTISPECIES: ABC transporter substrate-binding protein [unclassified Beijerinckia]MDH7799448.1 sulfonate transport system substrate-binding protein [Beijerinckia sp. GAS462]SED50806.1 NitT/TauT family transport system substrate-binding protein [Beijerinckia sp. 28-YEA-48]
MRIAKWIALAALAALPFAAPVQAQAPVKIRVAWVVPIANLPSLLMVKPELMRNNGKTYVFEPMRFQGTPPMITALATGELDIADFAYSSLALAIQNAGMNDLKVIADESRDGYADYYSAPYFVLKDGPIKEIKDLKGKSVASVGAGSAVDIALRAMLRKNGLEDKRDYNVVEAGFPNMAAMLTSKKVDLISSVLPFSLDPELQKVARPLFTIKDAIGPAQLVVWAAREPFLTKNRAAVLDFLEDSIRVQQWLVDPKNRDEVLQLAGKVANQPPERLSSWLFTKADNYRDPNLVPDIKALQANIDVQSDLGFLKGKIDISKYVDLSLVQEAAKRYSQGK